MKKKLCVIFILIGILFSSCVHYRYIPEERLKIDYNSNFRVEYVKTIGFPSLTLFDDNHEIYKIYPSNPNDNILIYIQLCVINITDKDLYFGDYLAESYLLIDNEDLYVSIQNRFFTNKEQKLVKANESEIINILFEVPREAWLDSWRGCFTYTRPGEGDINIYFTNRL